MTRLRPDNVLRQGFAPDFSSAGICVEVIGTLKRRHWNLSPPGRRSLQLRFSLQRVCRSFPMRVDRLQRRLGVFAFATAVAAATAGCGPNTDAYVALQKVMKSHITKNDHRPVGSVSCTPHVHDTVREGAAHLRCVVHFEDGSSYTANAIIQNENSGGTHNLPDSYTWDAPPRYAP
jgi:hypothetical protein